MRSMSRHHASAAFDEADFEALREFEPDVVLAFFSVAALRHRRLLPDLQTACAGVPLVGCSTSGEISGQGVTDAGLSMLALRFDHAHARAASTLLETVGGEAAAAAALARQLGASDLRAVLVLAPGLEVDGSALIAALAGALGPDVLLAGGLAGEGTVLVDGLAAGLGARMSNLDPGDPDDQSGNRSWTLHDGRIDARSVVAVGFYGERLQLRCGMAGGAKTFGPVRTVSAAQGHQLFELDHEPSLDIYRRYLGRYADQLPTSGLLFPFALLDDGLRDVGMIRTLVDIDEGTRSLSLAGDIAVGSTVRLMHASSASLIAGARAAADNAVAGGTLPSDRAAILISCADRKLVLGERVDDEIEAVIDGLGSGTAIAGFYANGEFGPKAGGVPCLNNQSMSILVIAE